MFRSTVLALGLTACTGGGDGGTTQPPVTQSIGLQLSSTSGTIARGASGNSTLSLSRVGGYTGSVALTAENLPTGVTAAFTPADLAGSASSATVVFSVGTAAAAGSSTITVRAAGSGVSAVTASYALTIPAPAVALTAGSGATSIVMGGSATVPITITRSNGFTDAVTLAATGLPAGVTATFTPATIAAGSTTSTLSLTVAGNATPGASTVTITASGTGVTTQTASLALTLTAAATPAVSLTSTPAALSMVAGANSTTVGLADVSTNVALTVTATGGGAGNVNWTFCEAGRFPLWFAFRDGTTGAWTRVTAEANQTDSFTINSSVGGVAYTKPLTGGPAGRRRSRSTTSPGPNSRRWARSSA